jgi:hypothetical protein
MAVRLQMRGQSVNDYSYRVKIIDTEYVGDPLDYDIGPNILIETQGNDRDLTEYIYTASATIDVFINNEASQDFLDDLINANEGRFYLQIDYYADNNTYFLGRIISNGISIEDRLQPFVKVQAIDGLTNLKNKDYDNPGSTGQKVVDVILYCLNQIDVVDQFYSASDTLIELTTCLETANGYFVEDPYLYKLLRVNNYFYNFENNVRDKWTCWEVLEELLKRLNLTLSYHNGLYYLTSRDVFISSNTKQLYLIEKDGTINTTPFTGFNEVDIQDESDTYALAGGTFYYEPGVKSFLITTQKQHTQKNLAAGLVWKRSNTTYSDMGLMLGGIQYNTFMKVIVPNQFTPQQTGTPAQTAKLEYFKIRFYFKALEWNGSDVDYPKFDGTPIHQLSSHIFLVNVFNEPAHTLVNAASETAIDVLFKYQNANLEFGFQFIFPQFDVDTEMQFRSEFVGWYDNNFNLVSTIAAPVNFFNYNIYHEFGQYPVAKPDVVKFFAETDTDEVEKKELELAAPNTYGNDQVKFWLWNGEFTDVGQFSDQWKFDSADSFEGLEYAMVRNYLKMMGAKQQFVDIGLNVKFNIPGIYYKILYRTNEYICSRMSWDVHQATAQITGIRIPTTEPTITVNLEAPDRNEFFLSLDNPDTNIYARDTGNIGTIVYQEFTGVTTSSVNLDDAPFLSDYLINFVQDLTEEQIRSRFEVYKDGIKQRYVPFDIPLTLDTRDFSLDWANNDVLINNDLGDSYTIEVKFLEV